MEGVLFLSYYDVYLILDEFRDGSSSNKIYFCDNEIIKIFGFNEIDEISIDVYNKLILLLDKTIEDGFNEGFRFAMDIFSNNL